MSGGHAHRRMRGVVAEEEEAAALETKDSSSRPGHENCSKVGAAIKPTYSSFSPFNAFQSLWIAVFGFSWEV